MINFFTENTLLCITLCIAIGLSWVSAAFGRRVCLAGFMPLVGGILAAACFALSSARAAGFAIAVFLLLGGGGLFLSTCAGILRQRIKRRRAEREEIRRRLQYTLPDKENTFVRARLNTVLQVPQTPTDYKKTAGGEPVRLTYARKLLAKLLEAPLSAAERLQAEDIGKTFALYLKKETWDNADLRGINDTFSALLKLSAKYAVAV